MADKSLLSGGCEVFKFHSKSLTSYTWYMLVVVVTEIFLGANKTTQHQRLLGSYSMGTSVAFAFSRHSCCCHGCIPNLKENINYQHIDNWLHIQVINVSFHFLQARNLYKQTGAKVSLSITSESGKQYVYNSHPTAQRAIKLQVGTPNPSLQKAPNTRPSRSTLPTLDSTHSPTRKTTVPRIMNIPGKKSATASAPSSNLCNKCVGCGIYFQSAEDMKEKRKYKKKRTNGWVVTSRTATCGAMHGALASRFLRERQLPMYRTSAPHTAKKFRFHIYEIVFWRKPNSTTHPVQ